MFQFVAFLCYAAMFEGVIACLKTDGVQILKTWNDSIGAMRYVSETDAHRAKHTTKRCMFSTSK